MSLNVSVYSADPVRGKIIQNLLRLHDFEVWMTARLADLTAHIENCLPDILIFDTKQSVQQEMRFLQTKFCALTETVKIVLCNACDAAQLLPLIMEHDHLVLEPFDPESICNIVTQLAEQRSKKKSERTAFGNALLLPPVLRTFFCAAVFPLP